MNRLSKKFLIGIVGIILLSCAGTIAFHTVFLERYYLHEKRDGLSAVCDGLSKAISQGDDIGAAIAETEAASQVIVVRIEQFQEKDNDAVNDEDPECISGARDRVPEILVMGRGSEQDPGRWILQTFV